MTADEAESNTMNELTTTELKRVIVAFLAEANLGAVERAADISKVSDWGSAQTQLLGHGGLHNWHKFAGRFRGTRQRSPDGDPRTPSWRGTWGLAGEVEAWRSAGRSPSVGGAGRVARRAPERVAKTRPASPATKR
jgi:hypothetical protein